MAIPIFQVDAFTQTAFHGNPAAVCLMSEQVEEQTLQKIASEMNLAETAFLWKRDNGFDLRWFTPRYEVDLCGHATLASAFVVWHQKLIHADQPIEFYSRSGILTCSQKEGFIELDFPAKVAVEVEPADGLVEALGVSPVFMGRNAFDYFVVLGSDEEVRNAAPNFSLLEKVETRGVIITAQSSSDDYDFVSRFFCPNIGINEDPVTGSAHCCLAPFWANQLGKTEMIGYQASERGGFVRIRMEGDRVRLGGQGVLILQGSLFI